MFRARIGIRHKGCWLAEISEEFNSLFICKVTIAIDPASTSSDILYVYNEKGKEFDQILRYLKSRKIVRGVIVLDRSNTHMYLLIKTDIREIGGTGRLCLYNNCFIAGSILTIKGEEIWTLETTSKKNIVNFMNAMEKYGKVRLISMQKSSFASIGLTEKQTKAVRYADELGYYNWPREIDVGELAKRLKLSKSTLLEHLRKAEIKIIKNYLTNL